MQVVDQCVYVHEDNEYCTSFLAVRPIPTTALGDSFAFMPNTENRDLILYQTTNF